MGHIREGLEVACLIYVRHARGPRHETAEEFSLSGAAPPVVGEPWEVDWVWRQRCSRECVNVTQAPPPLVSYSTTAPSSAL